MSEDIHDDKSGGKEVEIDESKLKERLSSHTREDIMFYHVPENLTSTGDASFDLLKDYISKANKKMKEQQVKVEEDFVQKQKLERQKIWEEEYAKKREKIKERRDKKKNL